MALLSLILVMTGAIISSSSRAWRQANAKIETFQAARGAFDSMTSRLGRATLNTYWDYYNAEFIAFRSVDPASVSNFSPKYYGRNSDLHFLCGPAATLLPQLPSDLTATSTQAVFFVSPTGLSSNSSFTGLSGLLGACGYFVAFGNDDADKPSIVSIPSRYRWRLMEVSEPVEDLQVFGSTSGIAWFQDPISNGRIRPVAENVIALIIWPRLSPQEDPAGDRLSKNFTYDSRTPEPWTGSPARQPVQSHQMPPNLQVTLVAIDEASAKRMEDGASPPAAITAALSGLFDGLVSEYGADLNTLESRLTSANLRYRVFSTTIALRESKWTP
jgi:uncharacterized protein (TIGR02599 family)